MSDIKDMLVKTADKIFEDHCTQEVLEEAEKGVWPEELWRHLTENGLTLVGFSEEQGGLGGDSEDALSLLKLSGYYNAPVPLAEQYLANWLTIQFGVEIRHDSLVVAGSADRKLPTLESTKDGWALDGRLQGVTWGRFADEIAVLAEVVNSTEYALVRLPIDAFEIKDDLNLAREPKDDLFIKSQQLGKDQVILSSSFERDEYQSLCQIVKVVQMAGALERVLDETVKYANERIQFGRPIGKFQAIKQQVAELAGEVIAAKTVAETMVQLDVFDPFKVNMAKLSVNRSAQVATKIAHQVIGAMGFTNEHVLHFSTKRLWAWMHEHKSKKELALAVGERALQSKEDMWSLITSE